jgi:pimeloyl-ACP methyl ester carboxylesterase
MFVRPLPPSHACTAGAFSAALNLYKGNFSAALFANSTPIPPPFKLSMPVLAVHPKGDAWCLEGQMLASKVAVEDAAWQYRQVDGGHWFFVQEPDVLNKLLLDFLG